VPGGVKQHDRLCDEVGVHVAGQRWRMRHAWTVSDRATSSSTACVAWVLGAVTYAYRVAGAREPLARRTSSSVHASH
jgi:hypothetical protein